MFILVGAYPEGTLGAATWALNTQNLKWLRKQLQRNRLNELAAFQAPSNSVQLMLRVPRMSPASKSGIPSIGAPQVYHHTGSPHAYFFNAPSGYRKDYRTYTNTLDGDN